MKAFRYNAAKRQDRKFNNCGSEKNPNAVKYYATNMDYANNYKYIYATDGSINYECELEVSEIKENGLFNMAENFQTLEAYKMFIAKEINAQLSDYTRFMNNATKASERKMWAKQIEMLSARESELVINLKENEFQQLSDFELQNVLVAELKSKGFEGYITKNEIAIF
jgi:hypothetical protein